jgi:hypothetical protein
MQVGGGVIGLLVPTRGRTDRVLGMWESARTTADHPQAVQLWLGLDYDDPDLHPLLARLSPYTDPGNQVYAMVGPRRLLSRYWNELARACTAGILWHGNDDVIFRSPHWDTRVRDAFDQWPDRIGCVHGNDMIWGAGQATLGFYSVEWCRAIDYPLVPPYFASDYNDTWLSWVADQVGRRHYLPEVVTEHMHPAVGKGPADQTHTERITRHNAAVEGPDGRTWPNVDVLYANLHIYRDADVARVRHAIDQAAFDRTAGLAR